MTIKLYLEDSYIKSFRAKVLSLEKTGDSFNLCLDRTSFYPVSGGQDHDTGVIRGVNGSFKVLRVDELDDGSVVHSGFLEGVINVGDDVEGVIDWDRRYRLMRMHTAAHILIQSVRSIYGLNVKCVSASKRVDGGHLDFSISIQRDMLNKIEALANSIVNENRPVIIRHMGLEEADSYVSRFGESLELYLRKHDVGGSIRIVEVKNWIAIPCGGTHVRSTGEIGSIKILKRESKGKGVKKPLLFSI